MMINDENYIEKISPLTRDGLLLVAVVALGQVGVEVRDVVVVPGVASNHGIMGTGIPDGGLLRYRK